jgi:UDP-N-acetylglucosamine--N-acetylmuramyl-(pentapeptide) pyrophosphoryl-undecaprenol N-acetylglucosamine transferase
MAALMGYPTAIQEQNSYPGFTNRLLGRFVRRVYLSFDEAGRFFKRRKITLVGNPVRRNFLENAKRPWSGQKGHVVVVGGSQGARAINDLVTGMAPILMERGELPPVLHQSGSGDYDRIRRRYDVLRVGARVDLRPKIDDMPTALSGASLVIGRAGALTLAELAIVGCPAILIPLPTASDDHQTRNAMAFQRAGAAVVLLQRETTHEKLAEVVSQLLADAPRRAAMAGAMRALGRTDAARKIVDDFRSVATGVRDDVTEPGV